MRKSLRFSEADISKHLKAQGETAIKTLLAEPKKIRGKGMNGTETLFSELLESSRLSGEISRWEFEPISLKVGPNTRYNPDFLAVLPDGHWQLFEIKGFLRDDAAVKFKAAAGKYPELSFMMLRKSKGIWEIIYNLPAKSRTSSLDPRRE